MCIPLSPIEAKKPLLCELSEIDAIAEMVQ